MKEYTAEKITDTVKQLFAEIAYHIDEATCDALRQAEKTETHSLARFALSVMNQNISIAQEGVFPVCQDTGMALVFVELGQDARISGGFIEDAVNEGVRLAYEELRKSVLSPLTRKNTKDNTPAVIHYKLVKGDGLKISALAKGFGSENMSRLFMLTPADGEEGIIKAVVQTVRECGGKPCPPIVLGIGIGGTMEKAALMSKEALLRSSPAPDPLVRELEQKIFTQANAVGFGAQGFKGDRSVLSVAIETYPTHIAGLPLAITVQCHVNRHKSACLEGENV